MRTHDTIVYIKLLAQDLIGCDLGCAILAILFDLAVPANYDGFEYLKTAIEMQYECPTLDLVNDIYQAVADKYGTPNTEMVSKAIRSAIRTAWVRGDTKKWIKYLPTVPINRKRPPTNAEVIAGLARIIELWKGCSEAYLRQQHKEVVSCGWK